MLFMVSPSCNSHGLSFAFITFDFPSAVFIHWTERVLQFLQQDGVLSDTFRKVSHPRTRIRSFELEGE